MGKKVSNVTQITGAAESADLESSLLSDWNPSQDFLDEFASHPELEESFRNQHRYERLWAKVCFLHEASERDQALKALGAVSDLPLFIWWLLEYGTEPKDTSKAGGEARTARYAPMRQQARRMFSERKLEEQNKGKPFSHERFAREFHRNLQKQHEAALLRVKELQRQIEAIESKINQGDLTAYQLRQHRAEKRELLGKVRAAKSLLPSLKVISSWLAGL